MNDIPIDRLGPYPILQLAAAVLVLGALAFAIYRGTKDRSSPKSPASIPGEERYYFDGPIGEHLKLMRDARNVLNEIKEHVAPLGEIGRNQVRELGEIKDEIKRDRRR